jgi:hypothetical protein
MSFEDEWAQHKAAAAEKHSTKMQLNQHMADPGGSGDVPGDLAVAQRDLAAIGDQAFKLYQRLNKDGDHAKASTEKAAGELKPDFALSGALSTLADKWNSQVDSLLQACGHISNHLDYTQKAHAGDEHYIATSFSVGDLRDGFDERTQR